MEKGEIILYQPDNSIELEVRIEADTAWLTQAQMAELFQKDRTVVTRHINNVFAEGELDQESNVHFLHIGASLKDWGKKLFAFSKLEISPEVIQNVISKLKYHENNKTLHSACAVDGLCSRMQ